MSKITFRADDELVERIEALDDSKSEVMREALREYLDGRETESNAEASEAASRPDGDSLDAILAARVDELVDAKFAARDQARRPAGARDAQDVNVNVTLETDAAVRGRGARGATAEAEEASPAAQPDAREPSDETGHDCGQCGESLSDDHVYCPNCGEKASRRVFCECGDEVRSDWSFCPGCGRRTPAADVLDRT